MFEIGLGFAGAALLAVIADLGHFVAVTAMVVNHEIDAQRLWRFAIPNLLNEYPNLCEICAVATGLDDFVFAGYTLQEFVPLLQIAGGTGFHVVPWADEPFVDKVLRLQRHGIEALCALGAYSVMEDSGATEPRFQRAGCEFEQYFRGIQLHVQVFIDDLSWSPEKTGTARSQLGLMR